MIFVDAINYLHNILGQLNPSETIINYENGTASFYIDTDGLTIYVHSFDRVGDTALTQLRTDFSFDETCSFEKGLKLANEFNKHASFALSRAEIRSGTLYIDMHANHYFFDGENYFDFVQNAINDMCNARMFIEQYGDEY